MFSNSSTLINFFANTISIMAGNLDTILASFKDQNITIKMKDSKKVGNLMDKFIEGGPSSLQVIADFDLTITRYHFNGERCHSSVEIMNNSSLVPDEFKTKSQKITDRFYAIELEESTLDQKMREMDEITKASFQNMVDFNISKTLLTNIVKKSKAVLRDNAKFLFDLSKDHQVPILFFSAGSGNSIKEILHQNGILYPNIKIISNYLNYNEDGDAVGYGPPHVHMYNKNVHLMDDSKYFQGLSARTNVLVLGDSLGDAQMAEGIPLKAHILKIGFLNFKIEERLEEFMDTFDIVLPDNQSMDFVVALFKLILGSSNGPSQG